MKKENITYCGRIILRFFVFIISIIFLWAAVFITDQFISYFLINILILDYKVPNPLSLSAVISFAIIAKALFRKIIKQKHVLDHIVALSFFLFCNSIGTILIILNKPSLAPPFYWLGLVGIFLYFAIKPFKKSYEITEKQAHEASNKHK